MGPTFTWSLGSLQIRINWLILACVLLTIFGFVRLGMWQWGRAAEKLAAQAEFEGQQLQNALPLDQVDPSALPDSELKNLHVALSGEYDNAHTILVLAQFFDGQIGYEVVTPFRLADSGRLVLVSRGWTSGILPPNTPPSTRPVSGPVELTAQIHVPDPEEPVLASQIDASHWPLRVRGVEIDVLERILGEPLFPYLVRLTEDQPGMLVRHWPETNVDVDTHLSYALQWYTFAVMVAIAALLASSNLLSLMRDPEEDKFKK
ncbi:MAG: SURF1 family protein [Gammaproteobacteria bacterium]|nr:SURF1 family protein [Pseudomonadales bacterium]MCP5345793.1 SURF1 family protein [Pseudomonadales bacterium]